MFSSHSIRTLCTPAWLYMVVSLTMTVLVGVQNMAKRGGGDNKQYHAGPFRCRVPNCILLFVLKLVGIFFWTWILDMICRSGHPDLSWLLVLFPYLIILFAMSFAMMVGLAEAVRMS